MCMAIQCVDETKESKLFSIRRVIDARAAALRFFLRDCNTVLINE